MSHKSRSLPPLPPQAPLFAGDAGLPQPGMSSGQHAHSSSRRHDARLASESYDHPSPSARSPGKHSSRRKPPPSFESLSSQTSEWPPLHEDPSLERVDSLPVYSAHMDDSPTRQRPSARYGESRKKSARPRTAEPVASGSWSTAPVPPSTQLRSEHSRSNLSDAVPNGGLRSISESSRHRSPGRHDTADPPDSPPFSRLESRSFSVPEKSSGLYPRAPAVRSASNSSDGRTTIVPVDMKRLLSKPAPPSNSGGSMPSDSEKSAKAYSYRSFASAPGAVQNLGDRREAKSARQAAKSPHEKSKHPRSTSLHAEPWVPASRPVTEPPPPPVQNRESRSRNVLRRKHSGRSAMPVSPPLPPSPLDIPSRSQSLTVERGPSPRGSPRPSGDPAQSASSTSRLTPAGAVAQAYKQQEKRRSDLEAATRGSVDGRSLSLTPSINSGIKDDRDPSPTPYYTVFGSTSGRVVAVGSPEDDTWNLRTNAYYPVDIQVNSRKVSIEGVRRGITRKVSTRWKKASITGLRKDDSPSRKSESDREAPDLARPSLQFSVAGSSKEKKRRSIHLSIDGFVDLPDDSLDAPSLQNGFSEKSSNDKGGKAKGREKEEIVGGKLWKLVKRISSNGLRDKFSSGGSQDAPPPVPALPKGISRFKLDPGSGDALQSPTGTLPFLDQPSSYTTSPSSTKGKVPSPVGASGQRRSTTRSSSPNSSDVASAHFFQRTRSARSSSSSYGDELPPPVPRVKLDNHIIPPEELYRLELDFDKETDGFLYSALSPPKRRPLDPSNDVDSLSVPFPSSRMAPGRQDNTTDNSMSSAEIPSFTTAEAINAFEPRKKSTSFKSRERPYLSSVVPQLEELNFNTAPPPRPTKSPMRRLGPSFADSPAVSEKPTDEQYASGRTSSGADSTTSTVGARPRSSSFSGGDDSSTTRSPITFREMSGSQARTTLTEKEKADRWEDLLERSEKAGGTIHLGGSELVSDRFRFSNISTNFV